MAGIYLHIPFCRKACHYCDFHFSTNLKLRDDMIKAMQKEIVLRKDFVQDKVDTIYFGGGTPSVLSNDNIENLLATVYSNFNISSDVEVTLEINPDDITEDRAKFWKSSGVNRISVGVQTFNDKLLKYLNRSHNADQALKGIDQIINCGIRNINIDIIYALPSENHEILQNDIKQALQLQPSHVSAYNLTIEPKTVFGHWLKERKISEMTEDFATEQYWILSNELREAGFDHYEVSNYGLPGLFSRHNTSYWHDVPYIGIGPGAHSYNKNQRHYNISNNALYIKSLFSEKIPATIENLSGEDKINEYLLTRLRTKWGINLKQLDEYYSFVLSSEKKKLIERLANDNLGELGENYFTLNEKGYLLADQIALELSV